jgi:hypothetical protein
MAFNSIIGSRAEVWHGSAKKTSGGLTKSHLMKNKSGRIVSKKKHFSAKKDNRLVKAGFKTKKGHFGFIKSGSKKRGHGKKMRGGMAHNISNASDYNHSSIDVQMRAGRGGEPIMNGGSPYGSDFNPEELSAPAASHKQAGGRRRSHKMRGGTTSKMSPLSPSNVEERALLA